MHFEKMYTTIDAHVAGEGFRVMVHSPFQLQFEQGLQDDSADNPLLLQAKQLLLNEPRGHRGMTGCLVIPSEKADVGVVFMHHEQEDHFTYSGLVAVLTVLLETGQMPVSEDGTYRMETSQGVIILSAQVDGNVVKKVTIPVEDCSLAKTEDHVELVEVGNGRRYILHSLPESIPTLDMDHLSAIMRWGREIADQHQGKNDYGHVLVEQRVDDTVRSVTIEKDGVILRSPGMDSTVAILASRNGQKTVTNESLFGSNLTAEKNDGPLSGFTISTRGFVTGEHRFIYDPDDPLDEGFLLK